MKTDFIRSGELKDIASYPQWLQEVVRDCAEARAEVVHHPFCVKMKEGTIGLPSVKRFLIAFWPTIERFPQYMAMSLQNARAGKSRGEEMARRYLVHNIRVEQKHADHWIEWAKHSDVSIEDLLTGRVPAEAHALSHWCADVTAFAPLAVAVAATNYAVEGATGDYSCFVCSEKHYEDLFPENVRKHAMRWLRMHAEYDDTHPWEALDIIATLLGHTPSESDVKAVRDAIHKSYEYMRLALDHSLVD